MDITIAQDVMVITMHMHSYSLIYGWLFLIHNFICSIFFYHWPIPFKLQTCLFLLMVNLNLGHQFFFYKHHTYPNEFHVSHLELLKTYHGSRLDIISFCFFWVFFANVHPQGQCWIPSHVNYNGGWQKNCVAIFHAIFFVAYVKKES